MKAIATLPAQTPARIDAETLLLKAVESGQPVDTIERLLALRERLQQEFAANQYRAALLEFQQNCPKIEKSTIVRDKDSKERYRYATLESILDIVKPILHKQGFSYDFDTLCDPNAVTVVMTISHVGGYEKKSAFRVPIDPKAYMSEPQKYEAAMSFAQRICFRNGFGLITGTNDTNTEPEAPPPDPPIGAGSSAHKALEARITELGLSRDGIKTWCQRAYRIEHFPDLTATQQRDLMIRLPGFAYQKVLKQIPTLAPAELEPIFKNPPSWLQGKDLDTVLEAIDSRLNALQDPVQDPSPDAMQNPT
jgi:hypothetical protein